MKKTDHGILMDLHIFSAPEYKKCFLMQCMFMNVCPTSTWEILQIMFILMNTREYEYSGS
jgi:hypothetical protein